MTLPVYLFDAPTSALDSHTEGELAGELGEVCKGSTSIIITHRLATARWAQRIAVLQHGRIQESGTHDELLLLGGAYARMWHLQMPSCEASRGCFLTS